MATKPRTGPEWSAYYAKLAEEVRTPGSKLHTILTVEQRMEAIRFYRSQVIWWPEQVPREAR